MEIFLPFFYPNYGNCYTFNHAEQSKRKNDSTDHSSTNDEYLADGYTLFLELFLHENESIPYIDERSAFRIFIHRQNEIPILSSNSLFIGPTTFTKLIYSQRIITFSRQCRRQLTDDMKAIFNANSTRYSQALCLKLCEFRFIEKECQCTDQLFMIFVRFFSENQTTQINTNRACPINHNCHANHTHFGKY